MHPGFSHARTSATIDGDELLAEAKTQQYHYTRCTFLSAPAKRDDLKKTGVPFLVSVTVLPENEQTPIPQVSLAPRCTACKAYLSPYCEVVPPGYKWKCSICQETNSVSSPLHSYGASLRVFSPGENAEHNRKVCSDPVLTEDVIEFSSAADRTTPPPAVHLFLVEATRESSEKGVLSAVIDLLPSALSSLNDPHDRAEVAVVLFGSAVQVVRFFAPESDGSDLPGLDTINEVESGLPLLTPTDYVVPLKKLRMSLHRKLKEIEEAVVCSEAEGGSCFGTALKVCKHILGRGGCVHAFLCTQPSVHRNAAGKNSTDLGFKLPFYDRVSSECLQGSIAIFIYALASKQIDLGLLVPLAEETGGDVRYYPGYLGTYHADREALQRDLEQHLALDLCTNAYLRVRVTDGLTVARYWGAKTHNDGLVKLSALRRGKTFSFEMEYDENLVMEGISFQVAVIFNTVMGERKVRVINSSIPLGPTAVDPVAVVHAAALRGLEKEVEAKGAGIPLLLRIASEAISGIGVSGMMHLFPRLIFALTRNKVFRSESSDLKGLIAYAIRNAPAKTADAILYPVLVRVDEDLDRGSDDEIVLPQPLRLSSSLVGTDGVYVLDLGIITYVFTGDAARCKLFEHAEGRIVIPRSDEYAQIRTVLEYMVGKRVVDPVVYSVHQSGYPFLLEGFQSMLLEDGAGMQTYEEFYHSFISKEYMGRR